MCFVNFFNFSRSASMEIQLRWWTVWPDINWESLPDSSLITKEMLDIKEEDLDGIDVEAFMTADMSENFYISDNICNENMVVSAAPVLELEPLVLSNGMSTSIPKIVPTGKKTVVLAPHIVLNSERIGGAVKKVENSNAFNNVLMSRVKIQPKPSTNKDALPSVIKLSPSTTIPGETKLLWISSFFLTQFLCQAICTQRTLKGPK